MLDAIALNPGSVPNLLLNQPYGIGRRAIKMNKRVACYLYTGPLGHKPSRLNIALTNPVNPSKPELRDPLILDPSPTAEYLDAIWNLQRWQRRLKMVEQNPDLAKSDGENFNRKSDQMQLMRRFNSASFKALFLERWDQSELWARKALEINPEYPYGLGNLANAYLYRGNYKEAIEIYRKYWTTMVDGKPFGSLIIDDFEKLKAIGITHPDTQRVLLELSSTESKKP